jgi:hypothetical protein
LCSSQLNLSSFGDEKKIFFGERNKFEWEGEKNSQKNCQAAVNQNKKIVVRQEGCHCKSPRKKRKGKKKKTGMRQNGSKTGGMPLQKYNGEKRQGKRKKAKNWNASRG